MTATAPALTVDEVRTWALGAPSLIVVTLVGSLVLRWTVHRVITRVVRAAVSRHEERLTRESRTERVTSATGVAPERQVQRMETLAAILRSLATFAIYGIAVLTCMAIIGIPLAPLLASAGVGGSRSALAPSPSSGLPPGSS